MNPVMFWAGVLLASLVLRACLRPLLGLLLGRRIGRSALAKQPDEIHLDPLASPVWTDEAARQRVARELVSLGFADAGCFAIREMPDVIVQLFANEPESFYGTFHQHPRAGTWLELTARHPDGASSFSTLPPSGLNPRPGSVVVRLPGATPTALWSRARAQTRDKPRTSVSVTRAAGDFASGYAESMRWRKDHGVSRLEVARVGARQSAGRRAA